MKIDEASLYTKVKVGVFALLGLLLIGVISVLINNRPYWWRDCQLVHIKVNDATGLKPQSPVRSLGIDIGYLRDVQLLGPKVRLSICITADVKTLPKTRAYIRGEGFLGDKFIELKPVEYVGPKDGQELRKQESQQSSAMNVMEGVRWIGAWVLPSANAQEQDEVAIEAAQAERSENSKNIPVGQETQDIQDTMHQVERLVGEMTKLTQGVKQAINPQELKKTVRQLNETLKNASSTLSPRGNLTTTAKRVLAKLEDAIEQLRDQMTRINQGEGSLGRVLNDPYYADQLEKAMKRLNKLLGKADRMQFIVDVGGTWINGYNDTRGWFELGIWPTRSRYYRLGALTDPRGRLTREIHKTKSNGQTTKVTQETVEPTGVLFTAMVGKVLRDRLDLSLGLLYNDAAFRSALYLGPSGEEDRYQIINSIYGGNRTGNGDPPIDNRLEFYARPWSIVYVRAGVEGFSQVNGSIPFSVGAGITFVDKDVKILFSFL